MKYDTFSILAGSEVCNARCPFCISKMTPPNGVTMKEPPVNWRNFRIAASLAERLDVTTAMITGKGEPTLFPEQVTRYLDELKNYRIPIKELQTNGILISQHPEKYDAHLDDWYERDLATIAISVVHHETERNREIYLPNRKEYIDLPKLIEKLHDKKFSVRLATVMVKGYIDTPQSVDEMITFAQKNGVEQLTLRPVNAPGESRDNGVLQWTNDHLLDPAQRESVHQHLERRGTVLHKLPYGAAIYDVDGQNVCLTNCLTHDPTAEDVRQLIFFPDGHLRYDWQYSGAILL